MSKQPETFIKAIQPPIPSAVDVPTEVIFILRKYPMLLEFYVLLQWASTFPRMQFATQKTVIALMNLTPHQFASRLKRLVDLGVLEIKKDGGWNSYCFVNVPKYSINEHNFPENKTHEVKVWADLVGVTLTEAMAGTRSVPLDITKDSISPNTSMGIDINTIISNTILNYKNSIKVHKVNSQSVNTTYPKEWYGVVLETYRKSKGIEVRKYETQIVLRVCKALFADGYTVEDIVALMSWMKANEDDQDNGVWVKHWNINTVQKKMAEFKAGKLTKKQGEDFEHLN